MQLNDDCFTLEFGSRSLGKLIIGESTYNLRAESVVLNFIIALTRDFHNSKKGSHWERQLEIVVVNCCPVWYSIHPLFINIFPMP